MRVLISGAGIAGPSLAWFLAKAGVRITIVEKSQSLLAHGQNVDLQGSAISVLKKMGLMDQVRQNNTTEKGTLFIDKRGNAFAPFPVREGTSASFSSEFEILRADLARILYEATNDLPNVEYRFGTTVKNVMSNNDDIVKVEMSDGEIEEFDLLVAADGQWSKVRKQCFPPESVKVVDKGMYVVYYTIPRLLSDNNWWNIYLAGQSRIITLRPDPHGTTRAMLTRMPCNAAQKKAWQDVSRSGRKLQSELVKREFADVGWQAQRILDAMDQAPDFYFHSTDQIKMSKWSDARVVCLGDAAFCPSPLTGMGSSLAINGAYVLAGELSKLKDREHPAKALEAFEDEFRPFVEKIQDIPSFIPAIAHPESEWKRWLFHNCVWVISKLLAIPWISNRTTDDGNSDDFPLPRYSNFELEAYKELS